VRSENLFALQLLAIQTPTHYNTLLQKSVPSSLLSFSYNIHLQTYPLNEKSPQQRGLSYINHSI
jgi:hypothetical protein